jgi:hypothetical protein
MPGASGGPRRGLGERTSGDSGLVSSDAQSVRCASRDCADSSTDADWGADSDGGVTVHFVGGASYPRFSRVDDADDRGGMVRRRTGPINRAVRSRQMLARRLDIFAEFTGMGSLRSNHSSRFGPRRQGRKSTKYKVQSAKYEVQSAQSVQSENEDTRGHCLSMAASVTHVNSV